MDNSTRTLPCAAGVLVQPTLLTVPISHGVPAVVIAVMLPLTMAPVASLISKDCEQSVPSWIFKRKVLEMAAAGTEVQVQVAGEPVVVFGFGGMFTHVPLAQPAASSVMVFEVE